MEMFLGSLAQRDPQAASRRLGFQGLLEDVDPSLPVDEVRALADPAGQPAVLGVQVQKHGYRIEVTSRSARHDDIGL